MAAGYTSRCRFVQRFAPSRLIIFLVEVAASGTNSRRLAKPTVMNGRTAMSSKISRMEKNRSSPR